MQPSRPTLRCVLPLGEYDSRYRQEPNDVACCRIILDLVITDPTRRTKSEKFQPDPTTYTDGSNQLRRVDIGPSLSR